MSELLTHARSMLAYNHWANERILDAAEGAPPEAWARVGPTLAHALGTQLYWHANWTHAQFAEPAADLALVALRPLFAASDAALVAYGDALTEDGWRHAEAWWKQWGYDTEAPVGVTLFQVVYHGIQHRAEAAIVLTEHGRSPGDLDFLAFLNPEAV